MPWRLEYSFALLTKSLIRKYCWRDPRFRLSLGNRLTYWMALCSAARDLGACGSYCCLRGTLFHSKGQRSCGRHGLIRCAVILVLPCNTSYEWPFKEPRNTLAFICIDAFICLSCRMHYWTDVADIGSWSSYWAWRCTRWKSDFI